MSISREEGEKMQRNFEQYLTNSSTQVEELRAQNTINYERFEREAFRNDDIRRSIASQKVEVERLVKEISIASEKYQLLEAKINSETQPLPSIFEKSHIIEELSQLNPSEMCAKSLQFVEYLSVLEKHSLILGTKKEILSKKVLEYNKGLNADILCVCCNLKYKKADNHENACQYHPGSLRYFSCRGCGADAYYQCCNLCENCSAGCIITLHRS